MKTPVCLLSLLLLTAGCATTQHGQQARRSTLRVRTTAYTDSEPGGCKNAVGRRLASGEINSASADWSRYPLGTTFRILNTGEVFQIDDYGGALIGTNTIDLYKTSRYRMRDWGVRYVDIQILRWGSPERSLEVLRPRASVRKVRSMIASLKVSHQSEL